MAKFGMDVLGAWVLKCNPKVWNLPAFLADGHTQVDGWSVRDNQRARSMNPGDPVVFWVSGSQKDCPSGVWAVGTVTSPAQDDTPDSYWLVKGATLYVGVHITLDSLLVPRDVIKGDPVLAESELIRAAQMSNPVMLDAEEWSALQSHLAPQQRSGH